MKVYPSPPHKLCQRSSTTKPCSSTPSPGSLPGSGRGWIQQACQVFRVSYRAKCGQTKEHHKHREGHPDGADDGMRFHSPWQNLPSRAVGHSPTSLCNSSTTFSTLIAPTPVNSRRMTTRSPCGRQISSSASAHKTRQGRPSAAARWDMPESCPTKATHDWSSPRQFRERQALRDLSTAPAALPSPAAQAARLRPRRPRAADSSFVEAVNREMNSAHLLSGQFFFSLPLPG